MNGYTTLLKASCETFTERKSVFTGSASPVETEREALDFISAVKSRYSDATHNVWAYTLRDGNLTRFSDDGEPHGTAGLPVLDTLRKPGITNAVIVVTRYFGGILLGAGGLVRAYSKAASLAVNASGTAFIETLTRVKLSLSYSDNARIETLLAAFPHSNPSVSYASGVEIEFLMRSNDIPLLSSKLADATAARAVLSVVGEEYGNL